MPLDAAVQKLIETSDDGHFSALVHCLPEEDRSIFSLRHMDALRKACETLRWDDHPVNIRLSIPTFFRRFYFVLIAGPERRSLERRAVERERHPVATMGNYLFLGGVLAVGAYGAILLETLIFMAFLKWFVG